ncbi:MAG: MerR family transcriptional regulator [Sphingobacteriales bacterium]|nr:MAG: MerR family transcriptional regulator [Sphingobacteriales bacterium]
MLYSIADLEQLSGIQSHTIRIWERRYNALKPMRTLGNTRLYDDFQLRKLLNIASLNQSGLKISKICSLANNDMERLLNEQLSLAPEQARFEYYVSQLLKLGLAYNEIGFDKLLTNCISKFGILDAYREIIYPILVRLGLMWRKDDICPAQEHFLTNIIKKKIYAAIDRLPLSESATETWLLFLPEDEDHEIGLLFANYLLKAAGKGVFYLGSKVPLKSVKIVLQENSINKILLFVTRSKPKAQAQKYLDNLRETCSPAEIYLAGNDYLIRQLTLGDSVTQVNSLDAFEKLIENQPVV